MIDRLRDAGVITALDVHFARAITRLGPGGDPALVELGAALACHAPARGDVCVDLATVGDVVRSEHPELELTWPDPVAWVAVLRQSPSVRTGPGRTPLVLSDTRLYLDRYHAHEDRVVAALRARAPRRTGVSDADVDAGIARLFSDSPEEAGQRRAAASVLRNRLTLLSGGPGTGKTSVVKRVLALLADHATRTGQRPPRVGLVAPTGKAAERLSRTIPDARASTIHRALGSIPNSHRFRHDADDPLLVDVLVVDEASMVDLPLMARLLDAVPADARLVLMGDPDQLASVELGSVLGDMCAAARSGGPLAPVHVHLDHTWRYADGSGIARLAEAVRLQDADAAMAVLTDPAFPDVQLRPPTDRAGVRPAIEAVYSTAITATSPSEALEALGRFRVLCAHRSGRHGVEAWNEAIESWLAEAGHIDPSTAWYPGRAVMVTRNDRTVNLFNGDVGIVRDGRVWFPGDPDPRDLGAGVLPEHVTVWATTVHKAQGSEHAHVVVVLPAQPTPLCTRELLYTAVTRASDRVTLLATEDVVRAAVSHPILRSSGLADRLR